VNIYSADVSVALRTLQVNVLVCVHFVHPSHMTPARRGLFRYPVPVTAYSSATFGTHSTRKNPTRTALWRMRWL
jgi:hypothetical protein